MMRTYIIPSQSNPGDAELAYILYEDNIPIQKVSRDGTAESTRYTSKLNSIINSSWFIRTDEQTALSRVKTPNKESQMSKEIYIGPINDPHDWAYTKYIGNHSVWYHKDGYIESGAYSLYEALELVRKGYNRLLTKEEAEARVQNNKLSNGLEIKVIKRSNANPEYDQFKIGCREYERCFLNKLHEQISDIFNNVSGFKFSVDGHEFSVKDINQIAEFVRKN